MALADLFTCLGTTGHDARAHAQSLVTNLTTDLAARCEKASNLSDVASAATARTNLGMATVPVSHSMHGLQFTSASALQLDTAADRFVAQPVTFNPTAIATATCKVEISPDNSTYTTLSTETVPIGTALAGTVRSVYLLVPAGWYVRFTVTNATLGQSNWW